MPKNGGSRFLLLGLLIAACSPGAAPGATTATVTTTITTASVETSSATTSVATPETKPPAGRADRILVTGPDGSVSIVALDGAATLVAEGLAAPLFSVQPTPSPDGSTIAHTAVEADGNPHTLLWTRDGSFGIDFGFAPFFYTWSPDASRLAALGSGSDGVAGAVADLETGAVTGIGSGSPHFLAWSPDGRRLATHRNGARLDFVTSDGATEPIRQEPAIFQAPDWISEVELLVPVLGSALSVSNVSIGAQTARLVAIGADGSTRDILEVDAISMFDLDPTGAHVAVFDGPPGDGRLRTVELGSGAVNEIDAPNTVGFEWSPDGSKLLTLSFRDRQLHPQVWSAEGSERTYSPFAPTATFVNEYLTFWGQYVRTVQTWAPDGSAFVFAAQTQGADTIFIQNLDEPEPQQLVPGSMAQWLP